MRSFWPHHIKKVEKICRQVDNNYCSDKFKTRESVKVANTVQYVISVFSNHNQLSLIIKNSSRARSEQSGARGRAHHHQWRRAPPAERAAGRPHHAHTQPCFYCMGGFWCCTATGCCITSCEVATNREQISKIILNFSWSQYNTARAPSCCRPSWATHQWWATTPNSTVVKQLTTCLFQKKLTTLTLLTERLSRRVFSEGSLSGLLATSSSVLTRVTVACLEIVASGSDKQKGFCLYYYSNSEFSDTIDGRLEDVKGFE